MKVVSYPSMEDFSSDESGIRRVVEAYYKYLPKFGIEFINKSRKDYDLLVAHAGSTGKDCNVAHLHGMYFTADYATSNWEYKANASIVHALRYANRITVPSNWVAEIFQRDMRFTPDIVPHGIEWELWQHNEENLKYVLWNKNRNHDVCTTEWLDALAIKFPDIKFVSTFGKDYPNTRIIGIQEHGEMKRIIQSAGVYLSTTKETFGIGVLEALASGTPVLGFNFGGNIDLIQHKVTGYLAQPGNLDDLSEGLVYCINNRDKLNKACLESVKKWDWNIVAEQVYNIYSNAKSTKDNSVSVIIPVYNYEGKVGRAIDSAINQTHKPKEIIVIDDGSSDNSFTEASKYIGKDKDIVITVIKQNNSGVAIARNNGIGKSNARYVCCLDADDAIDSRFLEVCVSELEKDKALGIAYTGLLTIKPDGTETVSQWPSEFNYDEQLNRRNQIPTCCVFRKEMWSRLGGFRQRYAPSGAGSEDAEFWLRCGAYGYDAKKVTKEPLFLYSFLSGRVSGDSGYKELDWTTWHPWTKDNYHPLASLATPSKHSHPVRQYDEPEISVIIPVGEGHEEQISNALDSLEAQSFRKWEAVVIWDSPNKISDYIKTAYPYIKLYHTKKPKSGPGEARNIGVDVSRGSMILYLDADDWLFPDTLEKMLLSSNEYSRDTIVYSDYVGRSYLQSLEDSNEINLEMLDYNEKTKLAVFHHKAADYDCQAAQSQPDTRLYHWCLVTCLIPKKFHYDIGGFDTKIANWEDVDYHWRMARAGKCYIRIREPLVVYNFATGNRRENASNDLGIAQGILDYIIKKYEGVKLMACRSCGGSGAGAPTQEYLENINRTAAAGRVQSDRENDADFELIEYTSNNIGNHRVVGNATKIDYGLRAKSDRFLIHKADLQLAPHLFRVLPRPKPNESVVDNIKSELITEGIINHGIVVEVQEGEIIDRKLVELFDLPPSICKLLESKRVYTREDLAKLSLERLESYGIGKRLAKQIVNTLAKQE